MTVDNKQNKEEQLDNDTVNQIKEIMKEEINKAKLEILEEIRTDEHKKDPYKKLEEWNKDAMERIKKELTESVEKGDTRQQKRLEKNAEKMDIMVNKLIGLVEKIKEAEKREDDSSNPLYQSKGNWWVLKLNRLIKRKHDRSTRNWLGLLFTGLGLLIISSGIWNASEEIFSIQGSILLGAIILGLMAWLERRKVFAVFGQE